MNTIHFELTGGGIYPISGRKSITYPDDWRLEITYSDESSTVYQYNPTMHTSNAPGTFTYDHMSKQMTYSENGHSVQFEVTEDFGKP